MFLTYRQNSGWLARSYLTTFNSGSHYINRTTQARLPNRIVLAAYHVYLTVSA